MLRSLHISNYALISEVDIAFYPGFNVITGETGAGKSIILGALSLILGGRADARVVTDPEAKTVVEAQFDVNGYDSLREFCRMNDLDWDEEVCILRREISPTGRSRAFINDSPVPVSRLREVAMYLIDIHSQHQNQLLATPDFQLQVIDTLAGNAEKLAAYRTRFDAYRDALRKLKSARMEAARDKQDEEYTRFQLEQIEALSLQPGEQAALEADRTVMANLTEIKQALSSAINALTAGSENALDLIDRAASESERLESVVDATDDVTGRLETIRIEIADISRTLEAADSRLSADPARLEAIEERLSAIYSLCRRHGVEDSDGLMALRDRLRARLDGIDNSAEHLAELERSARRAKALARESATEISEVRKAKAAEFAARLQEVAVPLGMKNLRVEIQVNPVDMNASGIDEVCFMFAFNKNQELTPVGGSASGGEISRLMLSIKSIIASRMQLPSIIFDEIDTGVSGEVADRMGSMMRDMASSIQVTAITHLPQVAAKANHHYKVFKDDVDERTVTQIKLLSEDERVGAIATMLAGSHVDEAALMNARSLLGTKPNLFNNGTE